ncbi:MAG: dihydroxy-acid dehydratase [Bacteroidota bacterium]|nr:dihydroxy-acid dehydratase [Bacteroidota bacterium]
MKVLRSHKWFYGPQETGQLHQGALRAVGIDMDNYEGQPVIGIANTWSEFNNCNMSLRTIAEEVKKGVREAGGIPLEFPVISLGEELMKPSAMLYRNLLSIEVEENIRSYPMDGVILLGNCDKTVPGLLMGAASADIPTIQLNAGPKKVGVFNGVRLGSGTDLWKYWDEYRIGNITLKEWNEVGKALSCGFGSCNTMGTASTMNGIVEALGMMPLGLSTLPVDDELRYALSRDAGRRIVSMVMEDLRPSDIMTLAAFRNAIAVCMALGGSTNAIIHLTALAGRMNLSVYPEEFNSIGARIPCIADVQPIGKQLIDDFNNAGGIPGVIKQLASALDLSVLTYTGKKLGEILDTEMQVDEGLIRPLDRPVTPAPTIAVLTGNVSPGGAVIKVSAAHPALLTHKARAFVFEDYHEMLRLIDDEDLAVDESTILILKNAGAKGVPGMPEWGMIPIPRKLREKGVRDMVRLSDSRMSGTSFGTVVLHITPEAATGGIFALVETGDLISLDVPNRKLELLVDKKTLDARRKKWLPVKPRFLRGYPSLYQKSILQADEGCDFDFLKPQGDELPGLVEPVVGRS